jgi:regulator of cell morphogenesis and NO signaling
MTNAAPTHDAAALTEHIETRYHARHRAQLPELAALAALAEKVETVHTGAPGAPAGLASLLHSMIGDMEVHMKKEELILFPAIRQGGRPGIDQPINVMSADHDDHAAVVARIRQKTGDLILPECACQKWTALYEGLGTFIEDLEEHMRLENDDLFPRFEGRA